VDTPSTDTLSRKDPPAERVRDDARRDLEQHRPQRERAVGDEHLEEAEPRVEQEQRVDTPDCSRRERVQPGERVVAAIVLPLDGARASESTVTFPKTRYGVIGG